MSGALACTAASNTASPTLVVTETSRSPKRIGLASCLRRPSPKAAASKPASRGMIAPNWSPPSLARVSPGFRSRAARRAIVSSAESPKDRPCAALIAASRSMSNSATTSPGLPGRRAATTADSSRSKNNSRLGKPVRLSWIASCRMRSAAARLSVTSSNVPITLHDVAAGVEDRPRLQQEPGVVAVRAAQPQIVADAARALQQHAVERGGIAVAVERMQHFEPAGRRPLQRAAAEAETALRVAADGDAVGGDVPIEDRDRPPRSAPAPAAPHRRRARATRRRRKTRSA